MVMLCRECLAAHVGQNESGKDKKEIDREMTFFKVLSGAITAE